MLYANDEVLKSGYTSNLDKQKIKNKKWGSIVKNLVKEHKLITTIAILFVICCVMNCVLIYTFIELLKNI